MQEKNGLLELGMVLQKYQIDQRVAIDFRKRCGAEHLYAVDNSETYVIHRLLQEVPDRMHTVVPWT